MNTITRNTLTGRKPRTSLSGGLLRGPLTGKATRAALSGLLVLSGGASQCLQDGGFEPGHSWIKSPGFGTGPANVNTSIKYEGSQSASFEFNEYQIQQTFSPSISLGTSDRMLIWRYEGSGNLITGYVPLISMRDGASQSTTFLPFTATEPDGQDQWIGFELLVSTMLADNPLFDVTDIEQVWLSPDTNFVDPGDTYLMDCWSVPRTGHGGRHDHRVVVSGKRRCTGGPIK
jgi:hypothetical protein